MSSFMMDGGVEGDERYELRGAEQGVCMCV